MQFLDIDASEWRSVDDFYEALLRVIGAPEGHGAGPDAFVDSMVWGGMNAVEPPYTVRISGAEKLPASIESAISDVINALRRGRSWRRDNRGSDVDVNVELVP